MANPTRTYTLSRFCLSFAQPLTKRFLRRNGKQPHSSCKMKMIKNARRDPNNNSRVFRFFRLWHMICRFHIWASQFTAVEKLLHPAFTPGLSLAIVAVLVVRQPLNLYRTTRFQIKCRFGSYSTIQKLCSIVFY